MFVVLGVISGGATARFPPSNICSHYYIIYSITFTGLADMASHLPCLWLECIVCCDMDMACLYLPLWNNSLTIAPTSNFFALDDMVITFNMLFNFGTECSSNVDILTHCFPS